MTSYILGVSPRLRRVYSDFLVFNSLLTLQLQSWKSAAENELQPKA